MFTMHLGVFMFADEQKVFAITTIPVLHTNELAFNFINFTLLSNFSGLYSACFWNHPSGSQSAIFDIETKRFCIDERIEGDLVVTCNSLGNQFITSATLKEAASAKDSGKYFIDCTVQDETETSIIGKNIFIKVTSTCSLLFCWLHIYFIFIKKVVLSARMY